MNALVTMVVLAASPVCFVPRDTQPGWKQVTLPPDGPTLAAPAGVDQFRSDETVEVVDDHPAAFLGGYSHALGQTAFDLTPGVGACTLELTFKEPLRGAKVDATVWGEQGTHVLMREERVAGRSLRLTWGDTGVRSASVVVHDHLRGEPIVESWKSTCRVPAARLPISDAYKLAHSLYYLQPVGQPVALCNKPDVPMQVRSPALPRDVLPAAVAVRRD